MPEKHYRFERLDRHHRESDFSCGVESLDRYFHRQASQDQRRGLAASYVLVDTDAGQVVGYYSLSMLSLRPAALHPEVARKLPHYDLFPAVLLGRLAVDKRYQRQGFGEVLLVDALQRALEGSQVVAALAVVVKAEGEDARSFYERHGFVRFVDDEFRLYLPMKTIDKLLSVGGST